MTDSIVIETPGGQRITLQDCPRSVRIAAAGSLVTLSISGVKVSATGAATITASGVELNAGMLTIHAGVALRWGWSVRHVDQQRRHER